MVAICQTTGVMNAFRKILILQILLASDSALLLARANSSGDEVTCRTNATLVRSTGDWKPLESELKMPGGIQVFTNCTFQINEGKKRTLQEGQILRSDGNLLDPDGSIMPVFDHIVMKGKIWVFKDGEGAPLSDPLTLPDGSTLNPDGTYTRPGRSARLVDGQLLSLDGAPMAGLDTISLVGGKVVVYKGGALIPLEPANKIMGMNDGTRVSGSGEIYWRDGTTTQLTEGQTITVEGVRANW